MAGRTESADTEASRHPVNSSPPLFVSTIAIDRVSRERADRKAIGRDTRMT
jgi:hypothetical protein